ncbi:MAG: GNAT family N-acetyltransferase [Rubrivivax sp.]|nr:GNAT family N-acetyltransferase [Rubrivivax sp.]
MDRHDLSRAPELLHTARLTLHAPRPEFGPLFVESLNRSLPGLRYICWAQKARDANWGVDFMSKGRDYVAAGEDLIYCAFERQPAGSSALGAYVGRIDLHSWDFSVPRCEIGYVGDVLSAGRGLMREAALACVQLAFDLGAVRVQALSEAGNTRALHFAQHALGFTREGELRHYERDAQGRLGTQVMFAAIKAEAPPLKRAEPGLA